jgi:hypothetical protein
MGIIFGAVTAWHSNAFKPSDQDLTNEIILCYFFYT